MSGEATAREKHESAAADPNKPVPLWRCAACGTIRTTIGSCHNHHGDALPMSMVWYEPLAAPNQGEKA